MGIRIQQKTLERVRRECMQAFPHEACGFLMGLAADGAKQVEALEPARNAREESERHHRYSIDPRAFLDAEKLARSQGRDIIGFYHSHPNAPARPSDYDREHAWPWYSYVIVSVLDGNARDTTSWVLQDDRESFKEEDIQLVS